MDPTPQQPAPIPAQPVVLSYSRPDVLDERPILSVPERLVHFCVAVLLPLACFGFAAADYPVAADWQRGRWYDRLSLIPEGHVGFAFYPLLLFSMYAAARVVFRPLTAIDRADVRVGLVGGVLLAWQYGFIQTVSLEGFYGLMSGVLAGVGLPLLGVAGLLFLRWAADALIWSRRWYRLGKGKAYFWIAVFIAAGIGIAMEPAGALGVTVLGALMLAPVLTMGSFVVLSWVAWRYGRRDLPAFPLVAGLAGWGAAMVGAWIISYQRAIAAYAQLPTTRPGCYVATAAARGHRRLVGARVINGRLVTPQLAMLKAGERLLAARRPGLHRAVRRVYDALGPRLAGRIRHPLAADLAYLALKPAEWAAALVLLRRENGGNPQGHRFDHGLHSTL